MKKWILFLCLITSSASAATLEDVRILKVTPGKDNVELRLQTRDAPKDFYFFVDVTKKDPASFGKLAMVIKKLTLGDQYKLNLEIKSFSVTPSGAYYRSESAKFFGTGTGD